MDFIDRAVSENKFDDTKSRTGAWVYSFYFGDYRCSNCRETNLYTREGYKKLSNFCPSCGYFLEGVTTEE